ncbi:MAG: hypothetical protein K2O41_05175 [Clostridia bacterium]|nr:hypothetical protein [Clostridia bacterium]
MAELRCYHHSNCVDRAAVARCTRCGKGLCRECADKLRSEDTGDILCVDCLNAEMAADANWAMQKKASVKKEIILIVAGFIIGLLIEITLIALSISTENGIYMILCIFSLFLFFPTLLASLGLIIRTTRNMFENFLLRIIFFLILCVASPIMFIVRIVRKARQIKILKRFAAIQMMKYEANKQYAEATRQMVSLPNSAEFEQQLIVKYNLFSKAEADRLIAEEHEKRLAAEAKNAESARLAAFAADELKKANRSLAEQKEKYEKNEILGKRNRANDRDNKRASSGNRAA